MPTEMSEQVRACPLSSTSSAGTFPSPGPGDTRPSGAAATP
jgi:hypothetical protein